MPSMDDGPVFTIEQEAKSFLQLLVDKGDLELWLATRFTIGMDATNALMNLTWNATDNPITGDTDKSINWAVGVVWNPQLRVLATLYF